MIRDDAANAFTVDIMCSMNHRNIVSMKAAGPKSNDGCLLFIEECDGFMDSVIWGVISDSSGHIPSQTLQKIVTEIIEGVEFLRRNNMYHGNLTWQTTLYRHPYTVKLCSFRFLDMSKEEAQWQDWMFIRQMLKDVSDKAVQLNQDPKRLVKFFCGEIDALIKIIEDSDRNSLHQMKEIVLEDVFFWTSGRRTMFVMSTVSELMVNFNFREAINNSEICDIPWNSHDKNGSLDDEYASMFSALLDHCINYSNSLVPKPPPLDPRKKADCVKFVCAAYTHQHQEDIKNICRGRVDFLFRLKYPKLFVELNRIIKARG